MNVYLGLFDACDSLNDLADRVLNVARDIDDIAAIADENDNIYLDGIVDYLNGYTLLHCLYTD